MAFIRAEGEKEKTLFVFLIRFMVMNSLLVLMKWDLRYWEETPSSRTLEGDEEMHPKGCIPGNQFRLINRPA